MDEKYSFKDSARTRQRQTKPAVFFVENREPSVGKLTGIVLFLVLYMMKAGGTISFPIFE